MQLPAEILLMVIKLMPDFPSLDHFIQASPIANGIFEELPVEITETLIDRLPTDVAELIRAFSASLSKSWTDDRIPESGQTQMREQVPKLSLAEPTRILLLCDLTLPSVKDLLRVACRIHSLTTFFFETYINRLNAIRPMHLVNPSHNFGVKPFVNYPEGHTYTPIRTGPASCVEELQVARALWHLQFYLSLRSDVAYHTPKHVFIRTRWEFQEMKCVQEFLLDNHICLYSPNSDQPMSKTSSHPVSPTLAYSPLHSSILADSPKDASSKPWRQDAEAAKRASPATNFFHSYGRRVLTTRFMKSSWRPFRRLGFDIWDLKRMCALELMDVPGEASSPHEPYRVGVGIRMSLGHMGFIWRSIEKWEEELNEAK